ncbi:unnamed protein product [Candidula unifasciata]|uniref:Uncharacterized protein n=1 Tax=Candidula unifasciata TaxID=100452 RepID=A0A8S3YM07_9EUPU|nr:unnamed protein product [Candidula unifasciata]
MTPLRSYMQKKKKVVGKYSPDTFRVISEDAECEHPKYQRTPYRSSFEPPTPTFPPLESNNNADNAENIHPLHLKCSCVLPLLLADYRSNNPHPASCGFLDKNVRFLNEPICNVYTAPVHHEEKYWWPARSNPGKLKIPPFAEETHYRIHYNCRHVPVNFLRERDGTQRFNKECVSYEHIYNSRANPNYPVRGKRHGAFVWKRLDPITQRKFTEYYERLKEDETRAGENGRKSPCSKEGSIHVIRSTNHKLFGENSLKQ